jgi:carboxypeptidase C (cathepsin A)
MPADVMPDTYQNVKMMLWLWFILFSCLWLHCCSSYTKKATDDLVHELPGADSPLLSNHFSGFLQISNEKFVHYTYVESERNPAKDSIIFWTNGGPGCSGLLGLFTEMGPWRPSANRRLERNPFSWTTVAGMVFLEQPAGVGFSYSTDPSLYSSFNDYRASKDNLLIIKKFFELFPERKDQDFYIASESYGGHYVPQWTLQIFDDENGEELRKHFKGYLVGNPFTSFASGSIAMANILWGLQLIPKPAW